MLISIINFSSKFRLLRSTFAFFFQWCKSHLGSTEVLLLYFQCVKGSISNSSHIQKKFLVSKFPILYTESKSVNLTFTCHLLFM